MREQPALALQTAAIAGQRGVCADHPVARDNDRDGIGTIRKAHRAHRCGPADLGREGAITHGVPGRDAAQRIPDQALKIRAVGRRRLRVSGKIGA